MKMETIRDIIYWEYSKLIAAKISGSRRNFADVTRAFKRLKSGQIKMSSLLAENKQLVSTEKQCVYCGEEENLQWEHIIPKSRGGADSIDNLVLACQTCNLNKGVKDPYEWYGKDRREEIPRIVVGKYLKLVYLEHEKNGTLDNGGFSDDGKVHLSDLMVAFEKNKRSL